MEFGISIVELAGSGDWTANPLEISLELCIMHPILAQWI